VHVSSS
jgi:adenylate kinase